MNSPYALSIFLIPAIGFVWHHRKHELEKRVKTKSGLELTYLSSVAGLVFTSISYFALRLINFLVAYYGNEKLISLKALILKEIPDHSLLYFLGGFCISFLASRFFLKTNDEVWIGDSKLCEIWKDLVEGQKTIIIFLKNNKCYTGFLTYAEVSERVPLEERVVSLIVFASGFRAPDGLVDWNTEYTNEIEHFFLMSEIVNFSEHHKGATFKISKKISLKKNNKK